MTVLPQSAHRFTVAREIGFPALAVAVIVASSDIAIPLRLPGHRGLVWLTMLVAVALVTRRRATVIAVGAASTMATAALHAMGGSWQSARYLAAAILLYAVIAIPVVRGQRWLLSLAAAPIHLVALAGSVVALRGGGHFSAMVSDAMTEKVAFHLVFGLLAGLLAWAVAFGMDGLLPANPAGAVARPDRPNQ